MIREPSKFKIQITDNNGQGKTCSKCGKFIAVLDDPEYVILWPAGYATPWNLHIVCYGEVVQGMVEFFKVFIEKQSKTRVLQ